VNRIFVLLVLVSCVAWACDDETSKPQAETDVSEDVVAEVDALDTKNPEDATDADVLDDSTDEEVAADLADDGDTAADGDVYEELVWGPCDTSNWATGYPKPSAAVQCTTVAVPLDYDNPGETLSLSVAVQRANHYPTGRAVFNLAGGPGGGALFQAGTIPLYLSGLRDDFDLVYVDQRGTGNSGYLACSQGYPETGQDWTSCAAEHTALDLDHFLTEDYAHDLNYVRQRLGYDKISLRGGSYGTRVGLEYMRQHPETIAAIVLDGLAPPDVDLFGDDVAMFDYGVDLLVADCAASPACTLVAPDLGTTLANRLQTLTQTPRRIVVSGQATVEDGLTFRIFLEAALYTASFRNRVPRAIQAASNGDNSLWNGIMGDLWGLTVTDGLGAGSGGGSGGGSSLVLPYFPHQLARDYVAPGVFAAVMCAEWFPNSGGVAALETKLAKQTWGMGSMLDLAAACAAWGVSPVAANLRAPVTADVPALLIDGAADLNTPSFWGDQAMTTLTNAHRVIVPWATHSTISVACAADVIVDFLKADGVMAQVDSSCIEALPEPGW